MPHAAVEGELERKGSRLVPCVLARLLGKAEDSLDGGKIGRKSPAATLEGHTDWVRALRFSADGKRLLPSSDDKKIGLRDTQKGCKIDEMFSEHTNCIQSEVSSAGFRSRRMNLCYKPQ